MKPIHKFKYAYCTSKPAPHLACFVVPPAWNNRVGRAYCADQIVQNETAKDCLVGRWYSLEYGDIPGERGYGTGMYVVEEVKCILPKKAKA
jgi:hypothetical protein